jgi:hypothetical protein
MQDSALGTLIGVGCVALVVVLALLFMKWESHHATTIWNKRIKKLENKDQSR